MLTTIEGLRPELARCVSRLERDILTEQEAALRILGAFLYAVRVYPQAWPAITAAMETVPVRLLALAASELAAKRSPDGWIWPLIGGMGSAGPSVDGPANPAEAAVSEQMMGWLRERVG